MQPTFKDVFSAWLKWARSQRRLTQEDLCERSGLSQGMISGLESGKKWIGKNNVEKLLRGLDMSVVTMCDELALIAHNKQERARVKALEEPPSGGAPIGSDGGRGVVRQAARASREQAPDLPSVKTHRRRQQKIRG